MAMKVKFMTHLCPNLEVKVKFDNTAYDGCKRYCKKELKDIKF